MGINQGNGELQEYGFFLIRFLPWCRYFSQKKTPTLDMNGSFLNEMFESCTIKNYSPIIIPPRTIWWAATFCPVQARSLSGRAESLWTTSSRNSRFCSPLLCTFWTFVISTFSSTEKESTTLPISRLSSHVREVSFWRCVIWACVSDIFLYNVARIIQIYGKNQGHLWSPQERSKRIHGTPFSYCTKSIHGYSYTLFSLSFVYDLRILYWRYSHSSGFEYY